MRGRVRVGSVTDDVVVEKDECGRKHRRKVVLAMLQFGDDVKDSDRTSGLFEVRKCKPASRRHKALAEEDAMVTTPFWL